MIDITLRNKAFRFETKPGLFSKSEIDNGTKLLIDTMQISPSDCILDIGCGYGPIGLTAAYLAHKGKAWMVDIDIRAIKYTKINARMNIIRNVEILASDGFEEIPDNVMVDVVASNPPSHSPKETLIEFIEGAKKKLKKGGKIYFVTERRLKPMIQREFNRVFSNYQAPAKNKNYIISMAVNA